MRDIISDYGVSRNKMMFIKLSNYTSVENYHSMLTTYVYINVLLLFNKANTAKNIVNTPCGSCLCYFTYTVTMLSH